MPEFDVLGSYLVSLLMSLSALCIFVWAVLSGTMHGADKASINFYETEIEHERRRQARP